MRVSTSLSPYESRAVSERRLKQRSGVTDAGRANVLGSSLEFGDCLNAALFGAMPFRVTTSG